MNNGPSWVRRRTIASLLFLSFASAANLGKASVQTTMTPSISDLVARFTTLPAYGIGALIVLLLYAVQSEVRFGKRARRIRSGAEDRSSTLAVSVSAAVSLLGFALAMKTNSPTITASLPTWFRSAVLPGMPALSWVGVTLGACGVALRFWAVLTLRERYTRTLFIQDEHQMERNGPYSCVRHPGYLGSLLTLNGIALASGNWAVLLASLSACGSPKPWPIGLAVLALPRS